MLTIEQLAERETYLGASEAAAIVGLNPWRSAWDCWAQKVGMVDGFAGNEATEAGDRLEDAVLLWACDQLGVTESERAPFVRHAEHDWMAANLDMRALVPGHERVVIEAKTSGVTSPLRHEAWGEQWTGEVPEYYQVQVQHQLAVTGDKLAFLAALLPPRGFLIYAIPRDDDVIAALIERESVFWHEHVQKRIPPDSEPSYEVAKRLRRTQGKSKPVPSELVSEVLTHKAALAVQKKLTEAAEAELLAALGDAEIGRFDGGIVTHFETKRAAYTVKESVFRTLRIKK